MLDKNSPAAWKKIPIGSTITLTDGQSIKDSMERGEGVVGRDYTVDSVWNIFHDERLAEWLLYKLSADDQDIWLVVRIVDRTVDLLVCFEPDEFEPGNRKDAIDQDQAWIFEEPDDIDNFKYDDLKFTPEIIWEITTDGEDIDAVFKMKRTGVMYCSCTYRPESSGLGRMMAAVIEYRTKAEFENPELMLFELGGENSSDGGLITLLIGCSINMSEIEVLELQADKPVERHKPSLWEKVLKKLS